jgi:hypothetical protein
LFALPQSAEPQIIYRFFHPGQQNFYFLLASRLLCLPGQILDLSRDSQRFQLAFEVVDCDQSSLRFYTGFFVPVKTNSKNLLFSAALIACGDLIKEVIHQQSHRL